jgi:hypothetical protein
MIKMENIINTAIATLITTGIITVAGYVVYIPVLKSQIEDIKAAQSAIPSQLSSDISQLTTRINGIETKSADLEKKYYLIAGFLQAKLNFNVQAFVDIAVRKGISQQQFKAALPVLEKNTKDAGSYLQNNLLFSPSEVKAVMAVPENKPVW